MEDVGPATESREAALQLLLGDREGAAAAARLFEERLDWMSAVVVCSDWGALPQLGRRLEELGVSLEGAARDKFRRWANAVFLRSASSLHQGARALAALADAGVDAAAFKGAAAVATLYAGPKDRTLGDTDVLVRRRDLEAAVAALEGSGFRLGVESSLPDHVEFTRAHPNAGNQSLSMFSSNGSEIDLHWHMGRVSLDTVLADVRPAQVYGLSIRTVSGEHGFLLGVHHMLRNGFELDRAVRDLIDCQGWLGALLERGEIGPLVRQAAAWGLAAPALAAVQILAHVHPTGSAAASVAAFLESVPESERRVADALTECFFLQGAHGRWNVDVLRALDVKGLFHFLRRTLRGLSSYTRIPRNKDPEVRTARSLPQRLRRFGRALPRTRWRLVLAVKAAQDRAFTPDPGAS